MNRLADLVRFYTLVDRIEQRIGKARTLVGVDSLRDLPHRGVYLFFEHGEIRRDSGNGPRIVRIGTHALGMGSRSTLRQRLKQHRGRASGGGNHRGSIFRLLIGQALLARSGTSHSTWGVKSDAAKASLALGIGREALVRAEAPVEQIVTDYLATMPFLWLDIDDDAGPNSLRGVVERNAIALLSNYGRAPLDPPSSGWLGRYSDRLLVRDSGLWNQRHVEETYDPGFLDILEVLIAKTGEVNDRVS